MADPTWTTRELPILEAVRAAEESGGDLSGAARGAVRDLPSGLYGRTIHALADDDYIDATIKFTGNGEPYLVMVGRLLPKGRRAVGQWPSDDIGAELQRVLAEAIAEESDPERRSRLERLRATTSEVGVSVVTSVLTELAKRGMFGG